MFHWPELGYGTSGVVLLYVAFYVAVRVRLQNKNTTTTGYHASNCYLLLYVPCLAHVLFFVFHSWDHLLSSLKFSLPLSVLFALLPHMIMRVNHTRALFHFKRRPIYMTTAIVLAAAVIFGYVRSREATRFFSLPDTGFARTGNFIRTNTVWQDVVFSREPVAPIAPPQMQSLAGRVVHIVVNLDHVYQQVQSIAADFTIKIFYYPHRGEHEINRLAQFLAAQDLPTTFVEDKKAGGLLAFDGKKFCALVSRSRTTIEDEAQMLVLGIESSCDDSAAAVVEDGRQVLAERVNTQAQLHADYGGVVPELAARAHLLQIATLVQEVLQEAGLQREELDAIAVTQGPGLVGSLLIGAAFAKGLAVATGKPLLPVNHVHAHLFGAFLGVDEEMRQLLPCLALIVSGGHTNLYYMRELLDFQLVAHSLDDACGEAFDKIAKVLGLGWPGGPRIEQAAANGRAGSFTMPKVMRASVTSAMRG